MKKESLPDFAKSYKKPGYDVRLNGRSYGLYKISSKRVKDKPYPVLIQEYIGVIKEDGSLKRKRESQPGKIIYQEFGLSDFLMKHYGKLLSRALFNRSREVKHSIVSLAILLYVLGSVSDTSILRCRMTAKQSEVLRRDRPMAQKHLDRLCARITKEQKELFQEELADFELLMRLCVVDSMDDAVPTYPDQAIEILKRRGTKL